jgi:phage terminase large subunit
MEYDRTRDTQKHNHIWEGGYLERSEAQVFKNWQVRSFDAPPDALYRLGADWGYAVDPTVLVRCFIGRWEGEPFASPIIADQQGRCLFIEDEAYKVGCAIDETPSLFAGTDRRQPPKWANEFLHRGIEGALRDQITADNSRLDTIDYMRKHGFNIRAANKGPGSVEEGIEFLKSYDMVVHPRCRYLIDELIHYSWATDRKTGEILAKLCDSSNHLIDALRYALEGARKASRGEFTFASTGRRVAADLPGYLLDDWSNRGPHFGPPRTLPW